MMSVVIIYWKSGNDESTNKTARDLSEIEDAFKFLIKFAKKKCQQES